MVCVFRLWDQGVFACLFTEKAKPNKQELTISPWKIYYDLEGSVFLVNLKAVV